jgi:hypothetical protein
MMTNREAVAVWREIGEHAKWTAALADDVITDLGSVIDDDDPPASLNVRLLEFRQAADFLAFLGHTGPAPAA